MNRPRFRPLLLLVRTLALTIRHIYHSNETKKVCFECEQQCLTCQIGKGPHRDKMLMSLSDIKKHRGRIKENMDLICIGMQHKQTRRLRERLKGDMHMICHGIICMNKIRVFSEYFCVYRTTCLGIWHNRVCAFSKEQGKDRSQSECYRSLHQRYAPTVLLSRLTTVLNCPSI